jgi:hypothetical protein
MEDRLWLSSEEICRCLAISRTTLFAIRRSGLLKDGRHVVAKNPAAQRSHRLWHRLRRGLLSAGLHWVRKNPRAPRSDLLWHREHCRSLLCRLRDPYAASPSNRRTIAALVCSPLISLR